MSERAAPQLVDPEGEPPLAYGSFREIIAAWPSRAEMASDAGVPHYGVVKQWHLRDSIPAARWAALVDAARARNIPGISLELFAALAKRQVAA